jgi:hypothetical protein
MNEKPWVAVHDGHNLNMQITAVQHGCGAGGAPVNCYIDEYRNWVCPNCMQTYGAVYPLAEWGKLRADGPR